MFVLAVSCLVGIILPSQISILPMSFLLNMEAAVLVAKSN